MGFKNKVARFFKNKAKEELKDLQNRADQFMKEYKVIRARYRCDFQAYMKLMDGGEGGLKPALRIIDATKDIEAEEEAERKKWEAIEKAKEKEKEKPIEPAKPSEKPGNDIGSGKF